MGYNAVYLIEKQPTFRRNMCPPEEVSCCLLEAGSLRDLFFDPEVGGDMFL
jgi:hypothetical protein